MWEPGAVLRSRSRRGSAPKIENGTASKSTKGSQPSASWEREQGSMRAGREGCRQREAWSTADHELSHHKRQVPRARRSAPNGQQRLLELRSSAPNSLLSVSHSGAGSTVSPEAGLPLIPMGRWHKETMGDSDLRPTPFSQHPQLYPTPQGASPHMGGLLSFWVLAPSTTPLPQGCSPMAQTNLGRTDPEKMPMWDEGPLNREFQSPAYPEHDLWGREVAVCHGLQRRRSPGTAQERGVPVPLTLDCSKCGPRSCASPRAVCHGPMTRLVQKLYRHLGVS